MFTARILILTDFRDIIFMPFCPFQVYRSFGNGLLTMSSKFSDNVKPIGALKQLQVHSVLSVMGESYNIDSIILCTGYKY